MEGSQDRPDKIGRYRILEVLGEGGMGMVYLGVQTEPIRRRVAIKIIKLGMGSKEFLNRFEAERQALAMMAHNNIARVFEAGATEEGQPFLVMEYAPGLSLIEHCDKHRLGTNDRLRLFKQICAGVQHAHHKGVIHRDLKPANVLVTMQQGKPVPKIIDFGLARASDHRLTEATIYTEQGRVIGTPEYMSPEQAEMSSEGIDTRTDVYSLGVMLYELLVGDLPFPAEELRKAGLMEVRRKICMDEPAKPSTRLSNRLESTTRAAELRHTTPAALIRELRSDLDWVVMHALEKDRDHRYGTAAALEEDIARYLNGEVVLAGPPSARYRIKKFVRRHRAQAGAAVMAVVLLVGWMVSATYLYFDAEASRKEADQNADIAEANADEAIRERERAEASEKEALAAEKRAEAEAEVATRVADFLVELFEYSRPDKALGEEIPVRMILDQGARRIETELLDQPAVRAKLLDTLARVYFWLGDTDRAESFITESLRLQEITNGANSREALFTRSFLADVQIQSGAYEIALSSLRELDARAAAILDPEDEFFLSSRSLLANVLRQLGRNDQSEKILRRALNDFRRTGRGVSRDMSMCVGSLAGLMHDMGRYAEARRFFEEAIDIERLVLPEGHPIRISTLQNFSRTLTKLGEFELAEDKIRQALAEGERVFGEEHPRLATLLVALGSYLNSVGRQREAEAPLRRALAIQREHLDPEHPSLAWSLNDLALQFSSMGRRQEAKELIQEAVGIYRKVFDEHLYLAIALGNLADIHGSLGEYADAERLALESLEMQRAIAAGDANIASSLGSLTDLYIKTGRLAEARTAAEEAVELLIALPEEKPRLAHTNNFLALIANISGDSDVGERHGRISLRLLDESGLTDHKYRARAEYHLASSLAGQSLRAEALEHFSASIALDRRLGLEGDSIMAWSLSGMGIVLMELGRYEEAVPLFVEAEANRARNLPANSPYVTISRVNLGVALAAAKQDEEAAPMLAESLRQRRVQAPSPDRALAVGLYFDAVLKQRAGSWEEASASAKEALKQSGGQASRDLRLRANITSLLGLLAAEDGELELAEKQLTEAHDLMSKGYAPENERRILLERIVNFYLDQDRSTEAQQYQDMLEQLSR